MSGFFSLRRLTQWTAWAVYAAIVLVYLFSLHALFEQREASSAWQPWEAWHIVKISVAQAGLSALGATVCGVALARAFFYLPFRTKRAWYSLISFAWTLPSLVVIFAIVGVWGNSGWLAKGAQWLGLKWDFSLYGLQGILLAHLFLNIPLVMKNVLSALNLIPSAQFRLAAQLGLQGTQVFRLVEWQMIKGVLPYVFLNVFLVCFTSFPIVLMLGGSPKFSTLEVAIYQAVTFEFDFHKAVWLILIQVVLGLVLHLLLEVAQKRQFAHTASAAPQEMRWLPTPKGWRKAGLQGVLLLHGVGILLPMASVVWAGISVPDFGAKLANPTLWESAFFSLVLSLIAAVSAVLIAYLIALETRQQAYRQQKIRQSWLASGTVYPLVLPVFLLAVGLFLLLMDVELNTLDLMLLVGVCNGLMLLPYLYRLIYLAMWQAWITHDRLAQSLGLTGLRRWWIVERAALTRPLLNAFALAMSSSLGSFAVIAFFGSPDFSTLPYLLYQQLGSYRTDDAAVTALVLMFCAWLPFLFIDQKASAQ